MRIFEDDAGYLAWMDGHQHGFVVNTTRKPDPGYLFLHRASCGTIRGKPARGDRWTTGLFIKACFCDSHGARPVGKTERRR